MTDSIGILNPNPSQIRILSWGRFSSNKWNTIVFLCELDDSYEVYTNNGYWKTIGLSFPKTENDKIAKIENILKLNTFNPNDKKKTFLLTQRAGDVALPHTPLEFGFTSVKGGQVMIFNSPDLDFFSIPNLYYGIKNEELKVEVNGFNYQASEKKIILEITKQDLKEHIYKAAVPVAKIIFSGNNPGKLAEIHKIIEYNFNKNEKQFTIKQIEDWPAISTWGELEIDLEKRFPNLIVEGKLIPQTTDPLLAEKNTAISDIDNALNQNPTINTNELETTNQNWRHDIQKANDLPTITTIKDRILADIKNKRQAKQGGSGPGPGNPDSPGTPGGPGDSPDNGNDPTTPTPGKDKNDVPPPSEDEVENRFNNDPAKQQIENNQQLTEDEKQATLKLLKTLIAAEILSEKGQFNQSIFDELLGEKNQQSAAYKTLNENGRVDNVIESLQNINQTPQNGNQPTRDKDEFPVWIFPVIIFLLIILIGAIMLVRKKKLKK
ncbi:protein of unknown function [endosymbiont DhMRE of Dentiscutata heterogama]|uniref:hypothetical protein n=1 Tax=endosymbiont DhMRE of Dentiscutata heterogama TaxID=1609546 RepID=UPI000629DC41|nr:hypothetical protein [endosymbiont DhMRE of Dentiscutata heterogama]CFW93479.1 protein of unknown function [endosymbiont DhMRE of Dentiscutata heterogama]